MPGSGAAALVFLAVVAAPAEPALPLDQVDRVLLMAQNAFEYRDVPKVIELLTPWVHPPRIVDLRRLTKARELLGISLHVHGDVAGAKSEFAEVLRAEPQRKLDPFVVPPAVIDAFEAVRRDLKPTLDLIGRSSAPAAPESVQDPPGDPNPLLMFLPLGLPHFYELHAPAWGSLWLALQLAGLGLDIGAYWGSRSLVNDRGFVPQADAGTKDALAVAQIAGLALFLGAWVASSIQGQLMAAGARQKVEAPQPVLRSPAPPTDEDRSHGAGVPGI